MGDLQAFPPCSKGEKTMSTDVTRARIGSTLRTLGAAGLAGAILMGGTAAMAGEGKKWRGYYYAPAPAYVVAPAPYYAPPPVVYAPPPRPVVYYPAPVAYAPAYPVYAPPPGISINLPLR
jgi:hypothetical protein